jgi:hypothetical protein
MSTENAENPVSFQLAGPSGHAILVEFINVCNAVRTSLKNVERCLFGNEEAAEYEISDLRNGSAANLYVVPHNGTPRYMPVRNLFVETISDLEAGRRVDGRLDYASLCAFRQFCSPIRNESFLSVSGTRLTSAYVNTVDKLLEPVHKSRGSVTGRLEALSVHGQRQFTLYPSRPDEEITCVFQDKQLLPRVLDALEKRVTVYGTLHFGLGRAFPTRVEVDDFDPHPAASELPSLLDMRGAWPPGPPSEEIVKALRDEWE